MFSGSEAGSYLRLIDSCIIQLQAQGPSRTCNESQEEEEEELEFAPGQSVPVGAFDKVDEYSGVPRKHLIRRHYSIHEPCLNNNVR
jgi:hypothetical protein